MSTAATAQFENGHSEDGTPLPLRGDTFLGVCEAIGQDLGINPNWLRVAFSPFVLLSPAITLAAYLGLGAVVALSRWFYPRLPTPAAADSVDASGSEEMEEAEERLAA